ncbi:non-ribosomal peptide synthetase [Streptomyces sp. CA2R106]|uniref:non-ribosomal peptide synthetase n=1 Tax=Streptomyces sp. CA2R106 TaxID=3120153 RepID=UPI00300A2FB7
MSDAATVHSCLPAGPASTALPAPIHRLVDRQAAATPDAVAVVSDGEEITYRALRQRSTALARELAARGVGPGDLVAVQLERSALLPIALLGILGAGAAYVPIDTRAPDARRDFILTETRARLLVTRSGAAAPASTPRLDIDLVPPAPEGPGGPEDPDGALDGPGSADDLMYVLYTSGTTGEPKGVMVPHAGVSNLLTWMVAEYGLDASDRILQKTPYTFDASVWELFAPLVAGGTLVMARPGDERDPRRLAETAAAERITGIQLVPAMLRHLLAEPALARCDALRQVFTGGEALTPALRDEFFERFSLPLHNLYGPTETSVQVLTHTCLPGERLPYVPIGRPIPNVGTRVLDDTGRPVPDGATGELYISGIALARGYLARPELTARAFRTGLDPRSPATRLYRTGDLVRRHPDGSLEFVARADGQVKVRGFRVEPAEIEAHLRRVPGVGDAAVLAVVSTETGSNRLVAHLEPDGRPPRLRELRERLGEALPDYMVPSEFRVTERFPLTAHGKLDRAALPGLPFEVLTAEPAADTGRAPESELERTLAAVWARTLGRPEVAVSEDFFEAGGDSLAGLQIIARARQHGIHLTPRLLFGLRRIDAIAAHLSAPETAPAAATAAV